MNSKKDKRAGKSKAPMVEWQVYEDERDWQKAQNQQHESLKPEVQGQQWEQRGLLRWGIPSLLVVFVLTLAGGWWLWSRAQRGLDEIKTELEAAVIIDFLSATSTGIPTKVALQEPSVLYAGKLHGDVGEMIRHAEVLDLGTDWAVIEVIMQPTAAGPTYRQTRVYHYGDRGWIREEATAEYWGVARQLESDHFIFHYYARDEEAMTEAAARLDALYLTLNASFGGHTPDAEKLTIRVVPEWLPGEAPQQSRPQEAGASAVVVASPAAMLVPADMIPGDVLLQSLVLALFSHFTEETAAHYKTSPRWPNMYNGLRLWLIWEQELPLAVWRKPLVKWVFSHSQDAEGQKSLAVPEFARDLCQHHKLWMHSPLDIAVPVHCWSQDGGEEKIIAWRYRQPPLEIPLSLIIYTSVQLDNLNKWHFVPQPEPAVSAVALATSFEYVASIFGAERVPMLLTAIPEHERTETLIPAVFDLSLEDFESGWRDFLQTQYDIRP